MRIALAILIALALARASAHGASPKDVPESDLREAVLALDDSAATWDRARVRLARAGTEAMPLVPWLVDRLSDREARVRGQAAWALGTIGPRHRVQNRNDAVAPLARLAATDADRWVRVMAVNAIATYESELADVQGALERALGDTDPAVRREAVSGLACFRDVGPALGRALAKATTDPDVKVRKTALRSIHVAPGGGTIDAVLAALDDDDPEIVEIALEALWDLPAEHFSARAIAARTSCLSARLGSSSATTRVLSAGLLARLDPHRHSARATATLVAVLVEEVDSPLTTSNVEHAIRHWVLPEASVPALRKRLDDPRPDIRATSLRMLATLGPAARPAMPAAVRLLRDSATEVRGNAAYMIAAAGSDVAFLPELMAAWKRAEPGDGDFIALAIARIGPGAAPAVPMLARHVELALADGRPARLQSLETPIHALGAIRSPEGVPALTACLRGARGMWASRTIEALSEMGAAARPALTALQDLTRDATVEPPLRVSACEAVAAIGAGRALRRGPTARRTSGPDAGPCRVSSRRPGRAPAPPTDWPTIKRGLRAV
jgi:HEAT repeat protein